MLKLMCLLKAFVMAGVLLVFSFLIMTALVRSFEILAKNVFSWPQLSFWIGPWGDLPWNKVFKDLCNILERFWLEIGVPTSTDP